MKNNFIDFQQYELQKICNTLIDPRNTAIPSGKLCKLMPARVCERKNEALK